jgi:hypothetical protein
MNETGVEPRTLSLTEGRPEGKREISPTASRKAFSISDLAWRAPPDQGKLRENGWRYA